MAEPKLFNCSNRCKVLIEIGWLPHVRAGLLVVGALDIGIPCARTQYDHGDVPQTSVGLHGLQHLMAVDFRNVQIEEDQIGLGRAGVRAFTADERKSFGAILCNMDIARSPCVAQSFRR